MKTAKKSGTKGKCNIMKYDIHRDQKCSQVDFFFVVTEKCDLPHRVGSDTAGVGQGEVSQFVEWVIGAHMSLCVLLKFYEEPFINKQPLDPVGEARSEKPARRISSFSRCSAEVNARSTMRTGSFFSAPGRGGGSLRRSRKASACWQEKGVFRGFFLTHCLKVAQKFIVNFHKKTMTFF